MLVQRTVGLSMVDGPGNRAVVFFQGCNLRCAYCHNPETWEMARDKMANADEVREMTVDAIVEDISKSVPFIRGITVSGGECMLYPDELTELFTKAKALRLSCLIDSNGTQDFSLYPELMKVTDGVMLDVKAWDEEVFRRLTGGKTDIVKRNIRFLAEQEKLEEIRIVCLEGEVDVEDDIRGIASVLDEKTAETQLKLIRFRKNGVIGRLADADSPTDEQMTRWAQLARENGFKKIIIT